MGHVTIAIPNSMNDISPAIQTATELDQKGKGQVLTSTKTREVDVSALNMKGKG